MAKRKTSDVMIDIRGDHKDLDNAIKKSNSSLRNFGTSALSVGKSLAKMATVGAVAVAGLTFAAWKLTSGFKDYGVELDKIVKSTGLSADFASQMAYAAEQEHASLTDLQTGWRRMSKAMSDADEGLAEAVRTFDALGLSIYDSSGQLKSLDAMTLEIADAFKIMTDDTKKAAIAQEVFGRSGMSLIPFLEMGSEGIKTLMEESKTLGNVWTNEMAAAAKVFDDKLTALSYNFKAMKWQLGSELMPEFDKIVDWLMLNGDWMKTTFTEIFDIKVTEFGDLIVAQLDKVKSWTDANKDTLIGMWSGFKTGIDMTITSIKVLFASIMTLSATAQYITAIGEEDEKARWAELQAVSASTAGMYQDIGQKDWAQAIVGGMKAPEGGTKSSVTKTALGPFGSIGIAAGTLGSRAVQQKIEIILDSSAVEKFLTGQVVGVTSIATMSGT